MNKQEILDSISGMSVLELSELVSAIEEKFNVSAAAPVAVAAAAPGAGSDAPAAEEKTEFDVVLTGVGESKINVIKAVRAITGLGLKESKDLVSDTPKPIKEKVSKAESEDIVKQLTEAGATCEVK